MLLFFIFIALCLGLALFNSPIIIGVVYLLFLLIIIKFKKPFSRRLPLFLLVFVFGIGLSQIKIIYQDRHDHFGLVYESKDNYFLFNSGGEKFYCYYKNHPYEIGDILDIKGDRTNYSFTVLESNFDFGNYLKNKGVYSQLNISNIDNKLMTPFRLNSFREYLLRNLDEESKNTLSKMLFSDNEDSEINSLISDLHLSRLISSSGLYINILISFIGYLLSFKMKNRWAKLIAFTLLSYYFIIAYPRFSLIRICFIFLFKWINEYLLKKRFNYLEILSISGLFFLLINHYLINNYSFILGFSIPIYLYIINNSFSFIKKGRKKILSMILIYLFFIPFEIKFFNSLSPLIVIYQILLTPFFFLFYLFGLLICHGLPISFIINSYRKFLVTLLTPFSYINLEIHVPPLNDYLCLIYYLILLVLIYYSSIRFKIISRYINLAYISLSILYILPIKNAISYEVTFINVGQGDSAFIRYKNKAFLIDTGGLSYLDLAKESLIPFLKNKRIYQIDLLITTHDDFDHNGAVSSLINSFRVKNYMTNLNFNTYTYKDLSFINYNNHINDFSEDNQKSLVIGFNIANTNYLIMGDADKKVEKAIMDEYINVPCDILKVGHHGSKTSSSDAFIKYLNPKVGIISCGINNRYGHPNKEVIDVLKKNNVEIRRTDIEGSITYYYFNFM